MSDYSEMTDEELNGAIALKQGWLLKTCACGLPSYHDWWMTPDGGVDYSQTDPPDYTHDWRLCGDLLEEMGNAITDGWEFSSEHSDMDGLEPLKWRVWMTRFTDDPADFRSVCGEADTPQRAICEAWLAWKED